jgi:3-oxoacyl-[acyl-carrier protein] reductase
MPLALVTGAARQNSIAAGIVKELISEHWTVATSDLQNANYNVDLEDGQAPAQLIRSVVADHGPISALILSHAHDVESGILDTTVESFDRHVAVNARASLMLIAEFARQIPTDGGAIVALTSDATTGNLPYGASKGALDRLVISAARELAPLGISANALNPGPIDTGWMTDEVRRSIVADQPSGRLGEPRDVAKYVAFLVSPAGRWVTGQLLHADGGYSAAY